MPRYGVTHNVTAVAAPEVYLLLTGGASTRIKLYDLIVGSGATPADSSQRLRIVRTTAAGSGGTALTEEKTDPLTAAPVTVADGGAFSSNPTTSGAALLPIPLNLRATFRWVAAPGSELISAAVSANGLAVDKVASTADYDTEVGVLWEE